MAIIVTIEMTIEVWDTSRDTSIGTTRSVLTKSFDESAGQGRAAAYTASLQLGATRHRARPGRWPRRESSLMAAAGRRWRAAVSRHAPHAQPAREG
jgi:hypothetical protein